MTRKYWYLLSALACAISLNARHRPTPDYTNAPWFTGPLYAPAAHVTTPDQTNIEPYYTFQVFSGRYDQHWKFQKSAKYFTNQLQVYFTTGITDWMDFGMAPAFAVNTCKGSSSVVINDFPFGVDFQLLTDTPDNYLPAVKFGIREYLPLGQINHLHGSKHLSDVGGEGAYQTMMYLVFGRLFHLGGNAWLNSRLSVACDIYSRIHVHGHNLYGGYSNTNGYVYPNFYYGFDFANELSLSQNWSLAFEVIGHYAVKQRFKGNPGTDASGHPAKMTAGSNTSYQLLPAIEYSWNENLGIITGAWFTVAGRNYSSFASWQTAINIVF